MEVTQNGKIVKSFYYIASTIYSVIELLGLFLNFKLPFCCGCVVAPGGTETY